jgi:hypothetical protein
MVSQCASTPPEKVVELYKEKGYSGIVVTEHYSPLTFKLNSYYKPQRLIDFYLSSYYEMKKYETEDFSVIFGMELRHYGTGADYLIYGIEPDWLKGQGNLMKLSEKQVYRLMHAQGWLVFQAHPFRWYIRRCNPKYIDGIEVYNGKCDEKTNYKALQWAIKTGKLMSSGSDFHEEAQLAKGGIITKEPIRNGTDLVRILKSGEYRIIKP